MSMPKAQRQMPARAGRAGAARGEAACQPASDEAEGPRYGPNDTGNPHAALLHAAFTRENLQRAFKRVRANKGAAGVDGLDIDQTARHLMTAWPVIREQLLAGTYRPSPVRRVMIPKPDGSQRELGIPTVVDRLIQQALLQVLQPILDPEFSEHSHGFRPGRRARDAVLAAQAYVQSGRRVVVDVDLEKFFDRVNHDVLMGKLAKRIGDERVLRLIRRYLTAGIMADGVVVERHEGAPQGGPLSPLLANVLLDEVDKDGSATACGSCNPSSGSGQPGCTGSCEAGASARSQRGTSTWPAAAGGATPPPRPATLCPTPCTTPSESRAGRADLNFSNRRKRTRTSGGVGGVSRANREPLPDLRAATPTVSRRRSLQKASAGSLIKSALPALPLKERHCDKIDQAAPLAGASAVPMGRFETSSPGCRRQNRGGRRHNATSTSCEAMKPDKAQKAPSMNP